jgi:hypothetical protein
MLKLMMMASNRVLMTSLSQGENSLDGSRQDNVATFLVWLAVNFSRVALDWNHNGRIGWWSALLISPSVTREEDLHDLFLRKWEPSLYEKKFCEIHFFNPHVIANFFA